MTSPIEIFFSYSHKDQKFRDELEKQLRFLERQGAITGWSDRKIGAGREWANEVDTHLNSAHIILLLVSPDYLASDYCYDTEMKLALERHEAKEAVVIPVILRSVDWKGAPFGKLQALPTDAKAVTAWPNRDKAFEDIAKGIRNIIEGLSTIPSTNITHSSRETTHQHALSIPHSYPLPCTYRGLSAFQEQDAPFFFGREVFIEQLMDNVRNKSLIAVIGPSGSGKSSLVFAGLIPRLLKEGKWCITSFRPRERPFRALATSLLPLLESQMSETDLLMQIKKLAEPLQSGELSLFDIVDRILQKNTATRLLMYIDQFEELYTLCRNAEDRQRFLDMLLEAIQLASQQLVLNFTLILTLRADFFGQVLLYRPFADARLIVSGRDEITGEETVEIVHEALIRYWNRLHKWMEENREFRLWQERLRARMSEWERANYIHSELLRGVMLGESENWPIRVS